MGNYKVHTDLTSLISLFKGLDVPTKIGRTFTGAWEQFCPDALTVATVDSYWS